MIGERLKIRKILPSNSHTFMYAFANKFDFFIYAHEEKIAYWGRHKIIDEMSAFEEIILKLTSLKYFNEKSEQCSKKLINITLNSNQIDIIEVGTCLIFKDLGKNYKAKVFVDYHNKDIIFELFDADEFDGILPYYTELPDNKEVDRVKIKTEKFKNLKKETNSSKIIDLIFEQPIYFKRLISYGYKFTMSDIYKYISLIDWKEISQNTEIDWNTNIIDAFIDEWDWEELCSNEKIIWTIDIIKNYISLIDWKEISQNTEIDWNTNIIDTFIDEWDWEELCSNEKIIWTINMIEKYKSKVSWKGLSKNHFLDWDEILDPYKIHFDWIELAENESFPWTKRNILELQTNIAWSSLCSNPNVAFDKEILIEFKDKIDWNCISKNTGKWWTKEIIHEFKDSLRWRDLCVFGTFWSYELIKSFQDYLIANNHFKDLSQNLSVPWTEKMLDEYSNFIDWSELAEKAKLSWSIELINRYNDKWTWRSLGENRYIPWTVELIEKNLSSFNRFNGTCSLWSNGGLPQEEQFWIKHKDLLFPKNKGTGWNRIIDASTNYCLPVSISLLYELRNNIDWNHYFIDTLKRTGKYKVIVSDVSEQILDLVKDTNHFQV